MAEAEAPYTVCQIKLQQLKLKTPSGTNSRGLRPGRRNRKGILLPFYRSAECFQRQKQSFVLFRKRDKANAHVEISGVAALSVYKQAYAPCLVCDENGPVDRLCDQKGSVSFALMPERYRKAGEAHCGKAVFGIHGGARRRKMLCCNLTKRKGEEPQNAGGLVTFSEDKGTGESFLSMLPGCGLKKGV